MSACDSTVGEKHQGLSRSPARMRKQYEFRHSDSDSNSDGESATESTSLGEQKNDNSNKGTDTSSQSAVAVSKPAQSKSRVKGSKIRQQRSEWEIVEGLKEGQKCEQLPEKYQGYMSKKKRWPMKGWHKRYFSLEKGILRYGKSPNDIQKGKYHGVIDVAMSVLTYKHNRHRIDIDTDQYVYHIKIKGQHFDEWLKRLHHHRLYRQHELEYGTKEAPRMIEITSAVEELQATENSRKNSLHRELARHPSLKGQERVATWLLDTQGFEHYNKALSSAQSMLFELNKDLDTIRVLPLVADSVDAHSTAPPLSLIHNIQPSLIVTPPLDSLRSSASNPNLHGSERTHPNSAPLLSMSTQHKMRIEEIKLRESFLSKADQVHGTLKMLLHSMSTERDRLKQTVDLNSSTSLTSTLGTASVVTLKQSLAEVCQQNKVLKERLAKIHAESHLGDLHFSSPPASPTEPRVPGLSQSFSAESCSISEYYDAVENNAESGSDSSSERSDEEISSDISDNDTEVSIAHSASDDNNLTKFQTGRRCKLPAPKPDTENISLWNILIRNIGKDLTKISMPVTLNEPLSMLQRLCEELEYSDLLDKATECNDIYERMIYIAAFAVSSYASSCYRIGHKPFNPLLGETYENIREDKGWKFMSEQVSHHPPISACYCDSKTFKLWQDVQIKTKFWGKSMEIQPLGVVNVILPKHKDHYKWNKVTTCVHNILGGQRWVDQFGEMTITNGNIVCKLTFTKTSHYYQGDKRHEVYGTIVNAEGKVVHNLFGKWNEALYCGHAPSVRCIWRPGAMPDDYELYYGFSRFAMELNEILPDEAALLPITDSRFRPDQRLVEEGKIQEAENEKLRIETMQRDKTKQRDSLKEEYKPMWFRKDATKGCKDQYPYTYDNKYWESRKDPTFAKLALPKLW